MRQFFSSFPRGYRLKPVGQREEDALSLLTIEVRATETFSCLIHQVSLTSLASEPRGALHRSRAATFTSRMLGALPSLLGAAAFSVLVPEKEISGIRGVFPVPQSAQKRNVSTSTRYNQGMMNIGPSSPIVTWPPSIQN